MVDLKGWDATVMRDAFDFTQLSRAGEPLESAGAQRLAGKFWEFSFLTVLEAQGKHYIHPEKENMNDNYPEHPLIISD